MKKIIYALVVLFVLILSQTIFSQVTWQKCQGVYGGEVRCFAVASNGYTYMGSNGSGIYRTTNGGDNWTNVNTGILNLNVRAMALNSSDHIYAGILDNTGSGILRSTNNGVNWNYTALCNNDIRTIAINSNGHIFVGTDTTGIYRSTDNGVSFIAVNNGLTFRYIRSIAIKSSGEIFAAAYNGGVFRSTDNGGNWTMVNTGITNLYINTIAVNPVNGYIFIGTGNGYFSGKVFRSTNNGGIWTTMSFEDNWILNLAINPSGYIYVGTIRTYWNTPSVSVYRSTDGGGIWELVGGEGTLAGLNALVINNTFILFGTNYSLYRSVYNGSFTEVRNGFTGNCVTSLFIKYPTGYVFAGSNYNGVFRSTNNGLNWASSGTAWALNAFSVNSFGYIYSAGSSYDYATLRPYVSKSTDYGSSWNGLYLPTLLGSALSITVNYLDYIFVGTSGNGILRSTANGSNWATINLSNNNVYSLLSVDSTVSIFAGTGGGKIFRSTDNGFGWDPVYNSNISTNKVKSIAKSPTNVLYAGLDTGGILISTNNGNNWTQYCSTISQVNAITFNTYGDIFVGTGKNGVYESSNNGLNWIQINTGLINTQINALIFDYSNYLYCGTNGGGLYKSSQPIGIKNISSEIPSSYSLSQNYPNPFNPNTNIKFQIKSSNVVKLVIFDILGKEVATLVNEKLQPGTYETTFDGSNLTSGIYFYRLTTRVYTETKKMLMIK